MGFPALYNIIHIVPLDPVYKTGVRGHVPAIQHLAEARSGGKNNQKENKKRHRFILKRMTEDCQPKERVKLWVASFVIESVKEAFITVIGKIKLHLRMTRYRK